MATPKDAMVIAFFAMIFAIFAPLRFFPAMSLYLCGSIPRTSDKAESADQVTLLWIQYPAS